MDSRQLKILGVRINKHSPLRGSSYVELPKWIRDVKNNADRPVFPVGCSVDYTSGDKNPQRVRKYLPY